MALARDRYCEIRTDSLFPPALYIYYLEFFSQEDVSSVPVYLFSPHLFLSVWTRGYLFESLGYDPTPSLFISLLKSFQLWKLFQVGACVLLTEAPILV